MIRTALFDLDGLLVDSEPVWFKVRTEMFGRFGLTWTDEDQKGLMGRSTQAWIEYVDQKLAGRLSKTEIVRETMNGMAGAYRAGQVRIMPGAQEALRVCADRFKVGLASGSPRELIDAALDANAWRPGFAQVVSSDEVPQGKPSPDVYVEALRRLDAEPGSSVVIEDSGSGILAGKAAGARVIAVPNPALMPERSILSRADVVIGSLCEFEDAIKTIDQGNN